MFLPCCLYQEVGRKANLTIRKVLEKGKDMVIPLANFVQVQGTLTDRGNVPLRKIHHRNDKQKYLKNILIKKTCSPCSTLANCFPHHQPIMPSCHCTIAPVEIYSFHIYQDDLPLHPLTPL